MARARSMLDYVGLQTHTQNMQQWLHERASVLRKTYIACLVASETARTIFN